MEDYLVSQLQGSEKLNNQKVKHRDYLCQKQSEEQENVREKTGRASVSESVEMLEEQRGSTVCWKHMRTAPGRS